MMEMHTRIKEITRSSGTCDYIFNHGQIGGYDGFHTLFGNLDKAARLGIIYLATDNLDWESGVGVLSLYTGFYTHRIKRVLILNSSRVICKRCGHITESGDEAVRINWSADAKEVMWIRSHVELLESNSAIEAMQIEGLATIYSQIGGNNVAVYS